MEARTVNTNGAGLDSMSGRTQDGVSLAQEGTSSVSKLFQGDPDDPARSSAKETQKKVC